jgi:predicted dienelactone hydrolase
MRQTMKLLRGALLALACCGTTLSQAGVGLTEIQGPSDDAPVVVFYPTDAANTKVQRGPFQLEISPNAAPKAGNRRLLLISHGSGGAPWTYSDLALRLVQAGFVVAFPEHRGDNYKSLSDAGPMSWERRPQEVSRAIDAVLSDPRFAHLLSANQVGVYGMSAGGHTALALAGGKWSPALLRQHCEAHLAEDFQTCVGLSTELTGGVLDGVKKTLSLAIIRQKLSDERLRAHTDARIKAIVAGVPFAADFDMKSLASPSVPLALVTAAKDLWLTPQFHSDVVLAHCKTCIHLGHFSTGGHGALLSPLPPGMTGLLAKLLQDPAGFDRAKLAPAMDEQITQFFQKQLIN